MARDLYSIYNSWPLVIAAYGCSPVTLNKSIHMSSNSMYFWDIYPQMPAFCRDLYPKVAAMAYVLNFHREHGIEETGAYGEPATDTVLVNKWLSFSQIASVLDVEEKLIQQLNPMFRKGVVPFTAEGYGVRVPSRNSGNISYLNDSFYRPVDTHIVMVMSVGS